jgi:hypothetical protein
MLTEMDEHHVIRAETPFPFDCKQLQPVQTENTALANFYTNLVLNFVFHMPQSSLNFDKRQFFQGNGLMIQKMVINHNMSTHISKKLLGFATVIHEVYTY